MSIMKVAITFIGTNKYLDFFPKYYESVEKYFLPNAEKTFLVFTDGEIECLLYTSPSPTERG